MPKLNQKLYEALCQRCGDVRVSNAGQSMQFKHVIDWGPVKGQVKRKILTWGESYRINCPFCSDTRQRLYISHQWAVLDRRTGDDNLHLAVCHNERCTCTRERQKQLHALVYPFGRWADEVESIPKAIKSVSCTPPEEIAMPLGTALDRLDPAHPACQYLLGRGFDPQGLGRDFAVIYCPRSEEARPKFFDERIVIPIYEPCRPVAGEANQEAADVRLAGWQARAISDNLPKTCPKYLTAAGMQKSCMLYGLPLALNADGPLVVVEGVTDAWRVGPTGLAMMGKTISPEQCKLIVRHFGGRPVIVWMDADAEGNAEQVREAIRRARRVAQDRGPVLLARTPPGRKDPGDCSADEVRQAIEQAMGSLSVQAQVATVISPPRSATPGRTNSDSKVTARPVKPPALGRGNTEAW